MTTHSYIRGALGLTLSGLLFSGYLSAVKFFTNTCALSEPCPQVWGHPACWYGFGLFFVMFTATLVAYFLENARSWIAWLNEIVSLAGIFFAGYLVWMEIARAPTWASIFHYTLGLPSCAYGLLVFIAIFVISLRAEVART